MVESDINKGTVADPIAVNPSGKLEKSSLVEFRNGKLIFKQKNLSFEKLSVTLQEIVKFRQMLESRVERRDPPLSAIPEEHRPLIAKLAHESDKSTIALAKHIQHELLPAQDEDEDTGACAASISALPLQVVEAAIKSVMNRNNYGLDGIPGGGRVPAAMCVWRWEVKDQYIDWLPSNSREKAQARIAERIQAKNDLKDLFESLPQATRDAMGDKGASKLSGKDRYKINTAPVVNSGDAESAPKKQPTQQQMKLAENEENHDSEGCSGQRGPSRPSNPERASKEKEKQEKKSAKSEKEKKAKEAELKSRSLLANFFGKAKTIIPPSSQEPTTPAAGPSSSRSDFERAFKPFVLKKDTELAPINWFICAKRKAQADRKEVIVIDDGDDLNVEMQSVQQSVQQEEVDVSSMDARDRLHSILSSFPLSVSPSLTSRSSKRPSSGKISNGLTVRDIFARLTEAEITGDVSLVRVLLSKLRDRKCVPAKVLIFAEDARPGYFGTWTRIPNDIGPRTPFAKDPVMMDYSCDSGEEWEEEGTEADDVVEDEEDEDADMEDADSDLESWLDDDAALDDETLSGSRPQSPSIVPSMPAQKRRLDNGEQKLGKKRKVIVPLAPFAKGPCWESIIGQCEYDPFKPYRIQLFNDTPFPIDPFTFVTTSVQEGRPCAKHASSNGVFAVPPLPERLTVSMSSSMSAPSLAPLAPSKRTPKTSFPDAHLPLLLTKISSLATGSISFLVESIYKELSGQSVKKNAIEAKVKEVGERCREKKIWVVKSEMLPRS